MLNLTKRCCLSYSICFGCFQCNRRVSVKKLHLFHINPPLSVSWGKMRFWVLFDEKTSLSSFSDEQHSFTRNWAQNEDLMLGGQFLSEIWGNYVSYQIYGLFGCFHSKRCVSVKKLHLFHINPPFSVSWGKMRFWVLFDEKTSLSSFSDEQHSFTRNWAQNEDLMLGGQFLCEIWGNYVSYHIYVFLDVPLQKRWFWEEITSFSN